MIELGEMLLVVVVDCRGVLDDVESLGLGVTPFGVLAGQFTEDETTDFSSVFITFSVLALVSCSAFRLRLDRPAVLLNVPTVLLGFDTLVVLPFVYDRLVVLLAVPSTSSGL